MNIQSNYTSEKFSSFPEMYYAFIIHKKTDHLIKSKIKVCTEATGIFMKYRFKLSVPLKLLH